MAPRLSKEKRQKWKENILKQRESGLSATRWCAENDIVIYQFWYWQKKLFPKNVLDRSSFRELSDKKSSPVPNQQGITIEYHGIRLLLGQFESSTLKTCLEVLREVAC